MFPKFIRVVGKPRAQQIKVLYPKVVTHSFTKRNKQEDSWECGYYVMSWIRTIIRAAVKDDWIERFKNPSPLSDDTIQTQDKSEQHIYWNNGVRP
ncbi:hypothetical protein DEO72_LG7g694 [Vigna unguiculata]|uniref:Ubiquitin-like protease family profile domain-containing protein n=1 Tax=Vigna unguiculata TaxID=3917 RepID=A0A4D6MF50_VIGUN|nr:hypothetical protein DEO72_LG7g694 [Vigna unguiculata]